jgi:hypothetical protein
MKICSWLSFLASIWSDAPERLPQFLQRHVERCDRCRESWLAETRIARALPAALPPPQTQFPPSLKQRILNHPKCNQPVGHAPRGTLLVPAGALALVVACAALLTWLHRGPTDVLVARPEPLRAHDDMPTESALSPLVLSLDRVSGQEWLRWGQSIHQPLELEWNRTIQDGQRLLATVVQSCVPEPAADALLTRTRQWMPAAETILD